MFLLGPERTHKSVNIGVLELLTDVTQILEVLFLDDRELRFEIFLFPLFKWLPDYQVKLLNMICLFSSINDLFANSSSCTNNSNLEFGGFNYLLKWFLA